MEDCRHDHYAGTLLLLGDVSCVSTPVAAAEEETLDKLSYRLQRRGCLFNNCKKSEVKYSIDYSLATDMYTDMKLCNVNNVQKSNGD
jgi:hypothetical protein